MCSDYAGFRGADDIGKRVEARFAYALYALEVLEKEGLGGGGYPCYA